MARVPLALAALVALLALAAGPASAKTIVLELGVQESGCSGGRTFCFNQDTLDMAAGRPYAVHFVNDGAAPHSFCAQLPDGEACTTDPTRGTQAGREDTVNLTAPAQPGSYRFYCKVPGHAQLGMEGNLTVTPAAAASPPSPPPPPSSPPPAGDGDRSSPGLGLASIAAGVALLAIALRRR